MPRFSVSLTDDQNAWVEERAEGINGSKTQVISMLVDAARGEAADLEVPAELRPEPTGGVDDEIRAELERINDRLDELEARVDAPTETGAATDTGASAGAGQATEGDPPTGVGAEADAGPATGAGADADAAAEIAAGTETRPTTGTETGTETETETDPVATSPGGRGGSADPQVVRTEAEPSPETGSSPEADPSPETGPDPETDAGGGEAEPLTRGGSGSAPADESFPDDPEVDAIREFVGMETGDAASASEVVACWRLLKRRGTASPTVFKETCFEGDAADEADLERWWAEGVRPVLEKLPGVAPPKNEGRFFRYKY